MLFEVYKLEWILSIHTLLKRYRYKPKRTYHEAGYNKAIAINPHLGNRTIFICRYSIGSNYLIVD